MKRCTALALFAAAIVFPVHAADTPAQSNGADLSGIYDCTGVDAHDGAFKATVTLTRDPKHSKGNLAGYRYRMDVEGFGAYPGSAAADGDRLAITFANEDVAKKDYGTAIARVTRAKGGVTIEKYYYQPEYHGGNHGTETCVRREVKK